jgi:hypothetical protein
VYAGKDPLTGREIRFRKTRRTEVEAQIEFGRLLELARAGRNPDSGVTVADSWGWKSGATGHPPIVSMPSLRPTGRDSY